MKKLMIAAAIVCAAAMSQAASIEWASMNMLVDKTTGEVMTSSGGYDFYLVCLGTTADYTNPLIRGDKGEFVTDEGANGFFGSYTLVSGTDANDMIYAVMAKDASGKLYQIKEYGTDELVATYTLSGFKDDQSTPDPFYIGNEEGKGFYVDAAAIPEPTSGLLLLLGVAGLALRRRRA